MKHIAHKLSIRLSFRQERENFRSILEEFEKNIQRGGIADTLEIIIGELANNLIKSNLKRLFFSSKGFKFDEPKSYQAGLKAFRENFPHLNLTSYDRAMQLLNIKVEIECEMNKECLLLLVQTNNEMTELEEKIIRERFKKVMGQNAENMLDLYIYFGDETASDGLGLAMVIDLIRKIGFHPKHLRVYNEDKFTKIRLELPLSEDYIYKRDKYEIKSK